MKRIIRSLDRMFLFTALASSGIGFVCLFSVFMDITNNAESYNAQITACVFTLTYLYWITRGVMYWVIKSAKQDKEAQQ